MPSKTRSTNLVDDNSPEQEQEQEQQVESNSNSGEEGELPEAGPSNKGKQRAVTTAETPEVIPQKDLPPHQHQENSQQENFQQENFQPENFQPANFQENVHIAQQNLQLNNLITNMVKAFQSKSEDSGDSKGTSARSPDKFSGTDRSKLRTYFAQCKLVFRSNPKKFKDDTKKVNYACSYLDGIAFSWYENHLVNDTEPEWFDSWELFEEQLKLNFGEINATHSAERKIRTLRMYHTANINDYITKFKTLSNDLSWNDSALSSQFRQGLAGRIKDELARMDVDPSSLTELTEASIRIDFRYWDREGEKSTEYSNNSNFRQSGNNPPRTPNTQPPSQNSQVKPNTFTAKPPYNNNSSSNPTATDLNLDSNGRVNSSEKQRRFVNKLCPYCGGNHTLELCPKQKNVSAKMGSTKPSFSLRHEEPKN